MLYHLRLLPYLAPPTHHSTAAWGDTCTCSYDAAPSASRAGLHRAWACRPSLPGPARAARSRFQAGHGTRREGGEGRGGEDSFPILRPKLPGYVLLYYVHTNVPPPGGVRERASLRIPNREVGSIVETALDGGDGQYPLSLYLSLPWPFPATTPPPPKSLSCVRGCVTKLTYPRRAVRGAPSLSLPTPQDQGQDPDR